MDKSLYDISHEYSDIITMCDEDGVLTDEALEKLDELQLDLKTKTLNISKVITSFDNNVDAIDKEIKRLTALKNTAKNNKERLMNYLSYNLEKMGVDKMDLGVFKLSFRSADSVSIDEDVLLPEEYTRIKIEPDKVALKKAIKEGKNIPGVTIVTKKTLNIK